MKKALLTGATIISLISLCGCSLFHHKKSQSTRMTNYVEKPPANAIEPRFDAVSPTTQF